MYDKDQIIREIKRVAEKLNDTDLNQKDFELNSTIPLETVKYYLGSWEQALRQAGVAVSAYTESRESGKSEKADKKKVANEDALLLDLIRIYESTGETPTALSVDTDGKYGEHVYRKYWKSLSDAFVQARRKFPEKFAKFKQKSASVSISDAESSLEQYGDEGHPGEKKEEREERMDEQKIKFIPQTIQPKETKKKPRTVGEPMDFRGLKNAPVDKKGVIYLFGLIAHEMGFLIESISPEFPDCESRRCVDLENNQWEHVKIQFEFLSSDVKDQNLIETECDLVICWNHDWIGCPVEVLELKSEIARF